MSSIESNLSLTAEYPLSVRTGLKLTPHTFDKKEKDRVEAFYRTRTTLWNYKTIAELDKCFIGIPAGTFECQKCLTNRSFQKDKAFALRIMPTGEKLMYDGLVCEFCVDSDDSLSFGGGAGQVRCAGVCYDIDAISLPFADSVMLDDYLLVEHIRNVEKSHFEFAKSLKIANSPATVDISIVIRELRERFLARRVVRRLRALVEARRNLHAWLEMYGLLPLYLIIEKMSMSGCASLAITLMELQAMDTPSEEIVPDSVHERWARSGCAAAAYYILLSQIVI